MSKRKIIEIYVTEEDKKVSYEFEKMEETEVTNAMMKTLVYALSIFNSDEL